MNFTHQDAGREKHKKPVSAICIQRMCVCIRGASIFYGNCSTRETFTAALAFALKSQQREEAVFLLQKADRGTTPCNVCGALEILQISDCCKSIACVVVSMLTPHECIMRLGPCFICMQPARPICPAGCIHQQIAQRYHVRKKIINTT